MTQHEAVCKLAKWHANMVGNEGYALHDLGWATEHYFDALKQNVAALIASRAVDDYGNAWWEVATGLAIETTHAIIAALCAGAEEK
jgi:hypothetical protein